MIKLDLYSHNFHRLHCGTKANTVKMMNIVSLTASAWSDTKKKRCRPRVRTLNPAVHPVAKRPEVNFNVMRSINSRFSYLRTYLLTYLLRCLQALCTSLPFMYFSALMDSVILQLLLLLLLHCLHCTVIQLFGYLHCRKCAK